MRAIDRRDDRGLSKSPLWQVVGGRGSVLLGQWTAWYDDLCRSV